MDWAVGMGETARDPEELDYDVVVVGAGAVGENAAARAVEGGLTAVLVEAELVGGECSYWACMPSKALLRPGHALAAARRVAGAREATTGALNPAEVLARRDSFASGWDDGGQVDWARGAGVDVVRGRGRLAGEREVSVHHDDGSGYRLRARQAVVLCAGSVPATPPITGLDTVPAWTSREGTSARTVPASLAVLGAGVVGVELAQAWARLGTRVLLIETEERPLPGMEEFVGDLVAEGLRADGVEFHPATRVTEVSAVGGGVALKTGSGTSLHAEHLMVATGRRAASRELGVQTVGLEPGTPLDVDDHGRVRGVDGGWLYAAGDVTDQPKLTHQGKYAARAVADVIVAGARGERVPDTPWSRYSTTANHHAVPQVVFTDPEVARVGRTADEAERDGYRIRTVDLDLTVAGSVLQADGYRGRAGIVVDADRQVILGAAFAGQDVAEMLHAATIAVVGEVPLDRLWHAVPVFPTMSEVWLRLLESYGM